MQEATIVPALTENVSGDGVLIRRERIDNTQLLLDTGLRVVHIRGSHPFTIAYRPRRSNSHTLEFSTSVTNPLDAFSRKIGTKQAVENFVAGKTVRIPAARQYPNEPYMGDVATLKFFFPFVDELAD